MEKRILITGAGGLLGRALLPVLRERYASCEIFAVTTNLATFPASAGIRPVEANLLSSRAQEQLLQDIRPTDLIHLAWDQRKATFRNDDTNLEWLAASLELLNRFARLGGSRMLFAGTSSEYDGERGLMCEDSISRSMSEYGACKEAFTRLTIPYGKRFGVSVATARYFTIYGEHDRHSFGAIPSTIQKFLHGEPVVCKAPNTLRDYIYAGDAAIATAQLLDSDLDGAVNIASGIPRAMREVFRTIAEEMDALPLLSFENEDALGDILVGDPTKMQREIGFRCETDFREGIRKTIAWWRAQMDA